MSEPKKIPIVPIMPERIDMPGNIHLIGVMLIFAVAPWLILWFGMHR